jgi:hypothetical protein
MGIIIKINCKQVESVISNGHTLDMIIYVKAIH